jgi:hypothetical protein
MDGGIARFIVDGEDVYNRWISWNRRLNQLIVIKNLQSEEQKMAHLLFLGGTELDELYQSIKGPDDTYEQACEKIKTTFNPASNHQLHIFELQGIRQGDGEPFEVFEKKLVTTAKLCGYATAAEMEKALVSCIIQNCNSHEVKKTALSKDNITLSDLVKLAKQVEAVEASVKAMDRTASTNAVNSGPKSWQQRQHTSQQQQPQQASRPPYSSSQRQPQSSSHQHHQQLPHKQRKFQAPPPVYPDGPALCGYCGYEAHNRSVCPAKNTSCNFCHIPGHFAAVCKAKQQESNRHPPPNRHPRQGVRFVMEEEEGDNDDSSFQAWAVRGANAIIRWFMPMVLLAMLGTVVEFLVDTGSEVNLLDKATYDTLEYKPKLEKSSKKIFGYGAHFIPVLGKFSTRVKYRGQYRLIEFLVVEGESGNLLSYRSSVELDVIGQVRTVAEADHEHKAFSNRHKEVNYYMGKYAPLLTSPLPLTAQTEAERQQEIVKKYAAAYTSLFSGKIGLLQDRQVKLHIDKSIQPVKSKLRAVPFHLREKVEAEIERMINEDIIEPVSGPTEWVSPIVPLPKPNQPGKIRICTDARAPNKAILGMRHGFPTMDDIAVRMNGAKVMSKLDLKAGYLQVGLHPDSRYITTFCTHLGLFQYKRLNFGVNVASEYFQKEIEIVLQSLPGQFNISDDIIVFGKDQAEHDVRLAAVLERLNSAGLTLNVEKCEFSKTDMDFFGIRVTAEGITMQEHKFAALKHAKAPTSASEVRSLLGLASYSSRFITDYATTVAPLRELTQKNVPWRWTEVEQEAFENLKDAVINKTTAYFDKNRKTELVIDASPVGLAAALIQYDEKKPDDKFLVLNVSRALSKVEQRYSQVEKEGLALIWACERLHLYLYGGKEFLVTTDNKAIEMIFRNPASKPKARIERWALRLLPYKFSIRHKPGHDNPADYLSRHPLPSNAAEHEHEEMAEAYVNLVTDMAMPKAISKERMVVETARDKELTETIKMVSGLSHSAPKSLANIKQELTTTNEGLVLRGNRVVVPKSLQKEIVALAHSGHMGVVQTKQLVRNYVWFSGIDEAIESAVRSCPKCQANTDKTHPHPNRMTPMPDQPWQQIGVDFKGPLASGHYLMVVVDDYSRYPIVHKIAATTFKTVAKHLNIIFAEFGVPQVLKSDNGPPFQSHDFKLFAEQQGFNHRRITPLWPQANAVCERFMRNLGKVLRSSDGSNWEVNLTEYLRNYRDTPHSSTGVPPKQLLFKGNAATSRMPNYNYNNNYSEGQLENKARINDAVAKRRMADYNDMSRKAKPSKLKVGDTVLLKIKPLNKSQPPLDPIPYTIIKLKHTMATISRDIDGKTQTLARDTTLLQEYHAQINPFNEPITAQPPQPPQPPQAPVNNNTPPPTPLPQTLLLQRGFTGQQSQLNPDNQPTGSIILINLDPVNDYNVNPAANNANAEPGNETEENGNNLLTANDHTNELENQARRSGRTVSRPETFMQQQARERAEEETKRQEKKLRRTTE